MDFDLLNDLGANQGQNEAQLGAQINVVDDAELKRQEERQKEANERNERIQEKINREMELRNEIRTKAGEYMSEFNSQRQKKIQENHEFLLKKDEEFNNRKQNDCGETKGNTWEKVISNIDTKEGDYKGTKDVNRMKEIIINKTNDNVDVQEKTTTFL